MFCFYFKQKTAYEVRISDWSSDVCSSDLAEVVALDHETMMKEADILRKIADNVAIKVPLTIDGLKTCKALTDDGTMVNVTLCFSANQALLAAKAGASFISPFVGRHDRSEEHTSELQSLMRISYAVYCLIKK